MANIWEKNISILAGNLNSGLTYPITTVMDAESYQWWAEWSMCLLTHTAWIGF